MELTNLYHSIYLHWTSSNIWLTFFKKKKNCQNKEQGTKK